MPKDYEIKMEESGLVPILDYLKGFSICTIVFMHLTQTFMPSLPHAVRTLASVGGSGVHLFFLCSGIGLYMSYLKRNASCSQFLRRRFSKIYLPYIAVALVSSFLPWMYKGNDRALALLSHVFLFKMFSPRYEESLGFQLWFISTLIQFYVLFIPLCRLEKKVGEKRFLALCFLSSLAWWLFAYFTGLGEQRIWGSFFLQYLWEFALGMVIGKALYLGKAFRLIYKHIYMLFRNFSGNSGAYGIPFRTAKAVQ